MSYTTRATRPATPGQIEWIDRKLAEHELTREDLAQRTGHAYDDLTSKTAGIWLDILFNLPPVAIAGRVTEPGLYVHDGIVHRVQKTQDGTRLYPKAWDGAKFVYDREGYRLSDLREPERITDDEAADVYGVREKQTRKQVVAAARKRDVQADRERWYGPKVVPTGIVAPVPSSDDEVADLLAHFS